MTYLMYLTAQNELSALYNIKSTEGHFLKKYRETFCKNVLQILTINNQKKTTALDRHGHI